MIGKVPRAGRGFRGLVNYLLRGEKGTRDNPSRVAWTDVRNLASDEPELAPRLMRATAAMNRRCQAPAYHFVISWRHDERPTDDIMRQVADATCADIGLEDFQRLYVAHADTRHHHLHVVVNRVHPETALAWNRRQDWVRIEQSLADQTRSMGMEHVPGRHNDPEAFGARGRRRDGEGKYRLRQRQREDELLRPWSEEKIAVEREGLAKMFEAAQTWENIDQELAKRDLLLVRKGQGLVIAGADGSMKVSALGKGFGAKRLEEGFGESRAAYLGRMEKQPVSAEGAERIEAFGQAGDANEALSFSFALHRFGLISRAQLQRHVADRDRVSEQVERVLTLRERIAREVARSLAEDQKENEHEPLALRRRREDERDR